MRSERVRLTASRAGIVVMFGLSIAVAAQEATAPGVHPISGRRIAPVMGYQGADWLERPERFEEEDPETALDVLKIRKGDAVADIGAGSGYMTVRLAKRVGPNGTVYANDLQPQMLDMLKRRIAQAKIMNVVTVAGASDNPQLADASVDLELLVDVYHEFRQPQAMLRHLRTALKPDGRLVLLEYRKEDPTVPIRFEHKMSVAEAKLEVEAEGFLLSQVDESLPRQHILIFSVKP